MFTNILVTAALLAIALALANRYGAPAAVAFGFISLIGVESSSLFRITHTDLVVGTTLATPDIEVHGYHVLILAALFVIPDILRRRTVSLPLLIVPLALLIIAAAQNDLPVLVLSGIVQWVFVALAWPLGAWIAEQRRLGRLDDRLFTLIVLTPVAANVLAVGQQLLGGARVSSIALGDGTLERVSGLEGHSGNLGKVLLLLLILLLPMTTSKDDTTRRLAVAGIIGIVVMTGLTYSRANMAAIGAAIVIWFVLQPGASIARRVGLPLVAALAAYPFLNTLVLRNEYDPTGGSRPVLSAAAWEQIRMTLWWGIGPNDYQRTVGEFSPISAVLPVHNTFLLTLAEAGLVVSVVIAYPLIRMIVRALVSLRSSGVGRGQAVAFVAALPGLLVVALTGHGLVTDHVMLLLFFILGFCFRTNAADMRTDVPAWLDARPEPLPDADAEDDAIRRRRVGRVRAAVAADTGSELVPVGSAARVRASITPDAPAPMVAAAPPRVRALAAAESRAARSQAVRPAARRPEPTAGDLRARAESRVRALAEQRRS